MLRVEELALQLSYSSVFSFQLSVFSFVFAIITASKGAWQGLDVGVEAERGLSLILCKTMHLHAVFFHIYFCFFIQEQQQSVVEVRGGWGLGRLCGVRLAALYIHTYEYI